MADPKTYTEEEVAALRQELEEEKAALLANRNEALSEAKKAKAALKAYDGVDAEEFRRLKTAAEEADRKAAEAKGDFETLRKQLVDAHAKEMGAKEKREAKLTKALESRLIDAALAEELGKAELADPTFLSLLKLEGRRFLRVKESDEDFAAEVVDERGNPLVADGKGTPMSVHDLVTVKLKAQYPAAFKGTGSSGGGASKSTGGAVDQRGVVVKGDDKAFLANLDGIASGKVEVRGV